MSSVQELNEKIAHCKDQLQELKAKTGLEAKYVKKKSQVRKQLVYVGRPPP